MHFMTTKGDEKHHICSEKVRTRLYRPEAESGRTIALTNEQIRHLKVLRTEKHHHVHVFDGKGHEYCATPSEKVRDAIEVGHYVKTATEPPITITLATAAPKGNRMDTLVEKVSELGVKKLVPIIFARSVVEPGASKIERLQRIAIEACAQSNRTIVPEITAPTAFTALLEKVREAKTALVCHKSGQALDKIAITNTSDVLVIIGPEGDFTPEELANLEKAGCKKVRLAPSTLRVETAAITALAQLASKHL
ncbi:16S rRNA (uracil(1498)-N(3))-methyltransferase [Candidatus Woesearchaeota archaeon]|nr:MAG: 16S rRNA (uracil(1498)-N(3))-methyltransferase [Candidatus Woesearchaeota archaeon]